MDLIFDKVSYKPDENVTGHAPQVGALTVLQLGCSVLTLPSSGEFNLGNFPEGGYSVSWSDGEQVIHSSFEVLTDSWKRLRYGFVAEFSDAVIVGNYQDWARKLHLTAIQFYDWAWKHEFVTTEKSHYDDPLGQEISTSKIRELISSYNQIGATPCGYVAVYAVDLDGWTRWKDAGLFDSTGKPYQLGDDFLRVLDPADPEWLKHLLGQLENARDFGFQGFHLDQYGYPRIALKADGNRVDLAEQFPKMLARIVDELPECKHIFNNVNDYPTWRTTTTNQDATYIEVWDPHSTYSALANLVTKTRELNSEKPIILSAYLKCYGEMTSDEDLPKAIASFELTCASITSGGASHLIFGGDGRVLYHAYYVTNYLATGETLKKFRNYYDFIVAAGDLLYDETRVDVSRIDAFGVNTEVQFSSEVAHGPEAIPGSLWIRIFRGQTGMTIHVINLLDQVDTIWNEMKAPISATASLRISIDAAGFTSFASVGRSSEGSVFEGFEMETSGSRLETSIEIRGAWTILNIALKGDSNDRG